MPLKQSPFLVLTVTLCLCLQIVAQGDEDLIPLENITVFPSSYDHNLRAGYLNITPYNQAFYYLFAERYF